MVSETAAAATGAEMFLPVMAETMTAAVMRARTATAAAMPPRAAGNTADTQSNEQTKQHN